MRGPLEVPPAGLADQEVVVGRGADVDRLADVPDPLVALRVVPADVRGLVGRRVVGDDQLEVLVGLRQQRVQRLGEVLGTVVDRQPDGQRRRAPASLLSRCTVHDGIPSGCPERLVTPGDSFGRSFTWSAIPQRSWYHQTKVRQRSWRWRRPSRSPAPRRGTPRRSRRRGTCAAWTAGRPGCAGPRRARGRRPRRRSRGRPCDMPIMTDGQQRRGRVPDRAQQRVSRARVGSSSPDRHAPGRGGRRGHDVPSRKQNRPQPAAVPGRARARPRARPAG